MRAGQLDRERPILRFVCSLSSFLVVALCLGASQAHGQTVLSMHRGCIDGGAGDKLFLRYWPPAPDNGIPEPVCVVKLAALHSLPIRSAHVVPNRRSGAGAVVVVEFDETATPLIEKMSRDNVGKLMAVVVGDRIVAMPMISRTFSSNKLPIGASTDAEVKRILAAVRPATEGGK